LDLLTAQSADALEQGSDLEFRAPLGKEHTSMLHDIARIPFAHLEPRQFEGRLLHQLPTVRSPFGEAYAELYLTEPAEDCRVSLTRLGTRVIADLVTCRAFWTFPTLTSHPAPVPGSSTTNATEPSWKRSYRWGHTSLASSTLSAAPRKNKPTGSPYMQSGVPFARPCWSCRARNTTGLISSHARRMQPAPSRRSEAWRPQVRRKTGAFRNRAEPNLPSANSSTMLGLCTPS